MGQNFAIHPRQGWVAITGIGPFPGRAFNALLKEQVRPSLDIGTLPRFGPDGSWIVAKENDHTLLLRETTSWELLHRFIPHEESTTMSCPITNAVVSPGGDLLVTASSLGFQCRLWEMLTGRLVATLNLPPGTFHCAFTHDSRWLLVTTEEGVQRFGIRRSAVQAPFALGAGVVRAACWHPDGRRVACGRRRELSLYSLGASGVSEPVVVSTTARYHAPTSVHHLAFSGPHFLVSGDMIGHERDLETWDLTGKQPMLPLHQTRPAGTPADEFRAMEVDEEGTIWFISHLDIEGHRNGRAVAHWADPDLANKAKGGSTSLAVGPRWIVAGCREGTVRTFPRQLGELQQHAARDLTRHPLKRCVLSPDESLALLADEDRGLFIVNVPEAQKVFTSDRIQDAIDALA